MDDEFQPKNPIHIILGKDVFDMSEAIEKYIPYPEKFNIINKASRRIMIIFTSLGFISASLLLGIMYYFSSGSMI